MGLFCLFPQLYRNLEIVEMKTLAGKDTITGSSFSVKCADDIVLTDVTGSLTINDRHLPYL